MLVSSQAASLRAAEVKREKCISSLFDVFEGTIGGLTNNTVAFCTRPAALPRGGSGERRHSVGGEGGAGGAAVQRTPADVQGAHPASALG